MKATIDRTPRASAATAASTIDSASATVLASGFSHRTCLPASSAAIAISAWLSPGVHTSTSWMSSRVTSCFQSVSTDAQPIFAAAAVTAAWSRPHSAVMAGAHGRSKNRPAVRHAWECTAPMKA